MIMPMFTSGWQISALYTGEEDVCHQQRELSAAAESVICVRQCGEHSEEGQGKRGREKWQERHYFFAAAADGRDELASTLW
jgi:hypothetical protein